MEQASRCTLKETGQRWHHPVNMRNWSQKKTNEDEADVLNHCR